VGQGAAEPAVADCMTPTVAIGLITCDRDDQTENTLRSFLRHNDRRRFMLFHADGGSRTQVNHKLAADAGFETVFEPRHRVGLTETLRHLVEVAATEGADWYLHLENDQEWVRPFPWEVLDFGAECVRLYGAMKGRSGPRAPAGPHLMGTKTPIQWRPYADGYEDGFAHWAGQPSVTRIELMQELLIGASSLKAMSLGRTLNTIRCVENVTFHTGNDTTPGFMQ
jgi:hypothetical protein